MPGVERIFVPGEHSHATRLARTGNGIPVAAALLRGLDQLAGELEMAKLI
jgi:L-2-hydroxycarboxylate dehydrogenase (NAD+)